MFNLSLLQRPLLGALFAAGLLSCGSSNPAVNPEPARNSLQVLAQGRTGPLPGAYFSSFDRAGRLVQFGSGVRRFEPATGTFEPLGADLGGSFGYVAGDDTIYDNGYRFDLATGFWSRLPPVSGDPLALFDASAATALGDEAGNLYALGPGGTVFRRPAKASAWEPVTLPTPAPVFEIRPNPTGHGMLVVQNKVPLSVTGSGPATTMPGGVVATGYDADGTGWSVAADVLIKVAPDGTTTQVLTTTNPLGVHLGSEARDAHGNFYAMALDSSGTEHHILRLSKGSSVWEDLAITGDLFDYMRVRQDGLVLVLSSPNNPAASQYVYEVYKTGDQSLLPDAHEPGVHFSAASVTLFPGDSTRVGLTLAGTTSLDGLGVTPGPGLQANPALKLSVHGAAGSLVITAAPDAAPGPSQVTVKSPKGESSTLTVIIAAAALPAGRHRSAHTLAAGYDLLGVKTDGTVWTWPGAREDNNPSGTAHQVQGVASARSVALDSTGYGPAWAVRSDGRVWAWNTARADVTPFLINGLTNIAAVCGGQDSALALDESGQVWAWAANQNFSQPAAPRKIAAFTDAVALAPGFLVLQRDGKLFRWDNSVAPAAMSQVRGLGAVVDVSSHFAVGADGSLSSTNEANVGDFVAPNGITASSSREYSYPINQSVYVAISATLGLRSDGTVWDGSVSSTVGDPVQQRFAHQLGTPPHAVAVATFGFVDAALLADGTVFQSRARDSLQGVSGFAKVPGLDSVLLPPGDVAAPDFDVLGPPVTDISPGSSADVPVTVVRLGGFTGDIAVSGAGLPAGLSLTPQTIPGAATTATLRFTAASSLVRFDGYLAVQLTSGALSHVTQFGFRTPILAGMAHPTLAVGGSHGVAVRTDGTVLAWGSNAQGELGQGTTDTSAHGTATAVPGLSSIVMVAAGTNHSLALDSSGKVYAWGDNSQRQCGVAGATVLQPTLVAGLPKVIAIAASGDDSLVLAQDGSIWQLQSPLSRVDSGPYVSFWFDSFSTAYVGIDAAGALVERGGTNCGITTDHVVRGAGGPDSFLALRDDLTLLIKQRGACFGLRLDYGRAFALTSEALVRSDGTVATFNTSNSGTATPSQATPVTVPGLVNAIDIVTSSVSYNSPPTGTTAVLLADGTVMAFGANRAGQAGTPMAANGIAVSPQPVPGLSGVKLP
jgi:alpha-tubulin suppressor-like RCC1 family protein